MSKKNNKDKNNQNNSIFSDLKNKLSNKYENNDNQDFTHNKDNVVDEEINLKRSSEQCIADNIGWNKPIVLMKNFLYGIFMGVSDTIPGYSGGTTLSIIGFYEELIQNIKLIFKPDVKKYFWKYLLWFLPFLIAWIGIFYGSSKIINLASTNGNGIILVFLFGFFALFSIPIFYIKNKNDLPNYKTLFSQVKKKEINKIIMLSLIILGFLVLLSFALMARFIPTSIHQDPTNPIVIQGVTFLGDKQINTSEFDSSKVFLWIFGGFLAGFCVLIPGVSGGLVLYMMNIYPELTYALSNFTANVNLLPWIVVVVIGVFCGVITSTIVINWMLKKWKVYFMCFSLGLVIASFVSIFVSLSSQDYQTLANPLNAGLSVLMIFIALIINITIFIYLNETKKVDYPKLRIIDKILDNKESVKN